ncbi:MAG: ImmA/IrrE family metallo-endopeptidase [bacterium]
MTDAVGWAKEFAAEHRVLLREETALAGGVTAYKYDSPDGPVVVLDASLPQERKNFALAHEAAHILLGHNDGVAPDEEAEANQLASELLLPHGDFAPDAWRSLRELKEVFPHASFEAIARRRLAYIRGVLTIVDDGNVKRRLVSEDFAAPPQPTSLEWDVIDRCYREKGDIEHSGEGLHLHACYVDTGRNVVRVLLTVDES